MWGGQIRQGPQLGLIQPCHPGCWELWGAASRWSPTHPGSLYAPPTPGAYHSL